MNQAVYPAEYGHLQHNSTFECVFIVDVYICQRLCTMELSCCYCYADNKHEQDLLVQLLIQLLHWDKYTYLKSRILPSTSSIRLMF